MKQWIVVETDKGGSERIAPLKVCRADSGEEAAKNYCREYALNGDVYYSPRGIDFSFFPDGFILYKPEEEEVEKVWQARGVTINRDGIVITIEYDWKHHYATPEEARDALEVGSRTQIIVAFNTKTYETVTYTRQPKTITSDQWVKQECC